MFEGGPGPGGPPSDDLVAYCHWLVDADEDGDAQQVAAARGALYGHLVRSGWVAPPRASSLLRLRSWTTSVEHDRLLDPARDPS